MSYQWHSQKQGSFDAIRLTWITLGTKRREVEKKKKNAKIKKNIKKCNFRFNVVTIKNRRTTYTGVTLSTSFTFILL